MDIRMPVMDGVEATRRLTEPGRGEAPRVLVLTTFDTDEHVVEALRAGASGFLLKDVTPADFVAAIRVVASGEALIAPVGDPPPARAVRAAHAARRRRARPAPGQSSPSASARSWRSSPRACPTARSPTAWSSPSRR